jgi:thymidine kinase
MGRLELIYGPMFSGKSTELIRRIRILKSINKKILVIKPIIDNRYSETTNKQLLDDTILENNINNSAIVSHNKDTEECLTVIKLDDIIDEYLLNYNVIIVDEAQFFNNLKKIVLHWVEKLNLYVIVGGLNCDYKRNPFGELLELIPYCDECTQLFSMCKHCNDGTKALFSHKLIDNNEQVLIGSEDFYIPLCRYHYNLLN